jgi:putative protease
MEKKLVGKVTHYFSKIGVAVIEVSGRLKVGDNILVEGSEGGPVEQKVDSMQVEHKNISEASGGLSVGMKMTCKVHPGNLVYTMSD